MKVKLELHYPNLNYQGINLADIMIESYKKFGLDFDKSESCFNIGRISKDEDEWLTSVDPKYNSKYFYFIPKEAPELGKLCLPSNLKSISRNHGLLRIKGNTTTTVVINNSKYMVKTEYTHLSKNTNSFVAVNSIFNLEKLIEKNDPNIITLIPPSRINQPIFIEDGRSIIFGKINYPAVSISYE